MKSAQIVLIEDNPGDVLLVRIALKEHGIEHVLTHFDTGNEAVQTLCAEPRVLSFLPDGILLDLNTPRTDGFEALRLLRSAPGLSGVPIAIFTSSRDRGDKQRANHDGARYIEKATQLDDFIRTLGQAVKEMLGSRQAQAQGA